MSSLGAKKNAKTAALMHLLFNIIGTVIFSAAAILYLPLFLYTTLFLLLPETALLDSYIYALEAFEEQSSEKALTVIEKETKIDSLEIELRGKHIRRLSKNECNTEAGIVPRKISKSTPSRALTISSPTR